MVKSVYVLKRPMKKICSVKLCLIYCLLEFSRLVSKKNTNKTVSTFISCKEQKTWTYKITAALKMRNTYKLYFVVTSRPMSMTHYHHIHGRFISTPEKKLADLANQVYSLRAMIRVFLCVFVSNVINYIFGSYFFLYDVWHWYDGEEQV